MAVWIYRQQKIAEGNKGNFQAQEALLLNRRKELIFLHNASLFVYRPLQNTLTTANDVREVS